MHTVVCILFVLGGVPQNAMLGEGMGGGWNLKLFYGTKKLQNTGGPLLKILIFEVSELGNILGDGWNLKVLNKTKKTEKYRQTPAQNFDFHLFLTCNFHQIFFGLTTPPNFPREYCVTGSAINNWWPPAGSPVSTPAGSNGLSRQMWVITIWMWYYL